MNIYLSTANRAWGEAADAQTLGLHFLACQRYDVEKTADICGFFGCSDLATQGGINATLLALVEAKQAIA